MNSTSPESCCDASTSSNSPEIIQQNSSNEKISVKFCRVCGDKALGYNFNVVTCESCKAFFRRNALKSKEFRCPFTNSCDVSVISRRFCQKCRLRKCFEVKDAKKQNLHRKIENLLGGYEKRMDYERRGSMSEKTANRRKSRKAKVRRRNGFVICIQTCSVG